ncbi:MAG: isoaspartyl peptidase/L-asparaginase [Acidobacteriota bacterium]
MALHGGAGTILRSLMTAELEREYRGGLETALRVGWSVLKNGGSSLDAVESAVVSLEDFPLFNAGRGSVFTHDGKNEMDACIMDGARLRAGAVAFVRNVKNPIKLARLVMSRTEHVLLGGEGANQFAEQMGVEMADDAYFFTDHRYEQLLKARDAGIVQLDHSAVELRILDDMPGPDKPPEARIKGVETVTRSKGTVGAVACDSAGVLAAATSTGGMTNKKFGRIGDTPIVGSGNYADCRCAVSCTGYGEYFMLSVSAFDVAARMKYKDISLSQATAEVVEHLTAIGGEGGLIAVDSAGNVSLPFNSDGMYRGWIDSDGKTVTAVYD